MPPRWMRCSLIALLLSLGQAANDTNVIRIPFQTKEDHVSPGITGPWPVVPITYDGGSLECHLTLWNQSIFVTKQPCVDTFSSNRSQAGLLCSDDLDYPPSFQDLSDTANSTGNFSLIGINSLGDYDFYNVESSLLPIALNLSGYSYESRSTLAFGSEEIELPYIVSLNITSMSSNESRPLPVLDSMVSLSALATSQSITKISPDKFFSLHLGSVDPFVPGSLLFGGFDDSRIVGDLLDMTINSYGDPMITGIRIGVESGFLPLDSLKFDNGSFPQAYSIDPSQRLHKTFSQETTIAFDPGLPYIYLQKDICDSLASFLDTPYDRERNLYLWTKPADDPLFHSPTYLEIVFGHQNTSTFDYQTDITIKIPFSLLQHNFYATADSVNTTLHPPERYFPCSPREFTYGNRLNTALLGKAFFQAAFIAGKVDQSQFKIAQAPGPTDMLPENIQSVKDGVMANRTNVIVEPNYWTKTWSSVLPIWTIDADGKTTLAERNKAANKSSALSKGQVIRIAIGSSLGFVIIAIVFGCLGFKTIQSSRKKWRNIRREMAEENRIAREIERIAIENERSSVPESLQYTDEPVLSPDAHGPISEIRNGRDSDEEHLLLTDYRLEPSLSIPMEIFGSRQPSDHQSLRSRGP